MYDRLETLERRLARVERQNRRAVTVALVIAVGAVTLASTGNIPDRAVQQVVRANRFVLEDVEGRTRGLLFVTEAGPGLVLSNEQGAPRLVLNASGVGAGLVFNDAEGASRVWLLQDDENGPSLRLHDEAGMARAMLGAGSFTSRGGRETRFPESSVVLVGPDGTMVWSAPR